MNNSNLNIGINSSISSCLTALILNPLDVIKTRQQEINCLNCEIHSKRYINHKHKIPNNNKECLCLPKFFNDIVIKEGMTSLWRGASFNILQSCFSGSIFMIFYQNIKRLKFIQDDFLNPLISGGTARIFTSCILFPLELKKIQRQSSKQNQSIQKIQIRTLLVTLKRDLVFSCIFWSMLEKTKIIIQNILNKTDKIYITLFASSIAGLGTGFLTTPIDVVKTRKQLNSDLYQNLGIIKSMKQIYKQDGIQGVFKGYQPRCLKTMFANCIYVSLFEQFMYISQNKFDF